MESEELQCRLCLRTGPTIKAHILAEGLLRLVHHVEKGYDGRFIMVGTGMDRPINRPTGSYDRNILCKECDTKLGEFDEAAINFCRRSDLQPHPSGEAFSLSDVNTAKLRLFAMSYAWRASITSLKEFNLVSLGAKHEEKIRCLLLNSDPGVIGEYDLLISKFRLPEDKKAWGMHLLNPVRNRFVGLNTVDMYLPNLYKVILKVDLRPFPDYFNSGIIGPGDEVLIYDRGEYTESQEFGIMHKAIMKSAQWGRR